MKKQLTKIVMITFSLFLLSTNLKSQNQSMFITCEGNFGSGNGSVSLFNTIDLTVENNYYLNNTSNQLGDVVQSMEIYGDDAYFVVNGSATVEHLQLSNGNSNSISGFSSPRNARYYSGKLYVTDWYSNSLQIVDVNTNSIINSIPLGTGPEAILIENDKAFVSNVGAWGVDSTVTIVDLSTETVVSTLVVGDKPNSIVSDINGDIWVLCGGYTEYDSLWNIIGETAGKLVRINSSTNLIEETFVFNVGDHPEDLIIGENNDVLYFSNGSWSKSVYKMNITDNTLPANPFINRNFYGIGYDPVQNQIYGADAVDYVQNGWVFRYANSGIIVDSFQVGIIPGGFHFWQPVLNIYEYSSNISIYPNPSNGRFFINSSEKLESLTIRNILGEKVLVLEPSTLSDVIDLSNMNSGIYLLEINTDIGVTTKKLILE